MRSASPRPAGRRRGLSLAESVTAMAVLTVAGAAALRGMAAGIAGADEAVRATVAAGLADDLAAEAFALPVRRPADRTPVAAEPNGTVVRGRFDEIDDFAGYASAARPVRPDGEPVGAAGGGGGAAAGTADPAADLFQLSQFARTVTVEPVEPAASGDGTAGGGWDAATDSAARRRVTVRVLWRGTDPPRVAAERTAVIVRAAD